MRTLTVAPHGITPTERHKARNAHRTRRKRLTVAVPNLLEQLRCAIMIAQLDLRDFGVADIHVERDDLDTFVRRALCEVSQLTCPRQ